MSTNTHIPFPSLDCLLPAGALDAMTPTEIGVAYRTLHVAWLRGGSVPADLPTIIALARLTEADAVHVQSLITLAGQREADGRSISFPILTQERERHKCSSSRRSAAGRANARARWGSPEGPGPDPGGGLRLAGFETRADANGNANGNAIGIANGIGGVSALSESSKARSSFQESAKQESSKRPSARERLRATGSPDVEAYALDLSKISTEDAAKERARRSAVHRQVSGAQFPGAAMGQDFLPSNVAESIVYAPWVTEELAAFAIYEARRLIREWSQRTPPQAFRPIGCVIAITGCATSTLGKPRQISLFFHQEWERRLEAQRQQANVHQAINAQFIADWKAKKAGGGA